MKRRNDLTLKEALEAMLREYRLDGRLKEWKAQAAWHKLMGKTIGVYISRVRVQKGVLYVAVLSAPLRQELAFAREKIRELINEEMGEDYIREVVIR